MRTILLSIIGSILLTTCKIKQQVPAISLIRDLDLKRGTIISCSPAGKQFGTASFQISCEELQEDFDLAVNLLHSFEYDEAEKKFADIIDKDPGCAMAYWGVAMANFHALWTPPAAAELIKGSKAIDIAQSLTSSKREAAYISAIAAFYQNWEKRDHHNRCLAFESNMEQLYRDYPEDKEAAIFYCLALDAAADPSDKTYSRQLKAGQILESLYPGQPGHPGIIHYLIHTYDYPGLAQNGLDAARTYASVAPASAHALHMPSHIFTRLGLWKECIQSNIVSVNAAQCYAALAGIKGHWDEEIHGMDYLVYAYLQTGENNAAKKQLDYLRTINEVYPPNFKVAYAFAATPARYVLENKQWEEASTLPLYPADFPWHKFPWQEAIVHFTRSMGAIHIHQTAIAKQELAILDSLHQQLLQLEDAYKANQVAVQIKTASAWMGYDDGNKNRAIALMQEAAQMEDNSEKHPVTPGEVLPARELLADMLLLDHQPALALQAYEQVLVSDPNRFNSLYGAGRSAQQAGDEKKANRYYHQLLSMISDRNQRRELATINEQYASLSQR